MAQFTTSKRRALKGAVLAGLTLGMTSFGIAGIAQADDVMRQGGHGGFGRGGNFGSHMGGGMRPRMDGGVGSRMGVGVGPRMGGDARVFRGGAQRFGGVAPAYGGTRAVSGYRTGRYAWTGGRPYGWRYGAYGVGTGLALGTGLAYGASAYPYGYDYGYGGDYAAPDYAYQDGDPAYAGGEYGEGPDPLQDDGDGGYDYNGTHYTCSPYEKKTRLQKRVCGNS